MPTTTRYAPIDSPLGQLWLAMRGGEAVAIEWSGEQALLDGLRDRGLDPAVRDAAGVAPLRAALHGYFRGEAVALPPLCEQGLTPFRVAVLRALAAVPRGATLSYGELAGRLGRGAGAARAIGGAVGANPVPILWACHRVLQGDGSLGGFSGGLARKRWLLEFEGITWREATTSATSRRNA